MRIRESLPSRIFDVLNYIGLGIVMLLTLYPFWHILMASVSNPVQVMRNFGPILYPLGWGVDNYKLVFQYDMVPIGLSNTVVIVVVGTALNLIITLLAAYAFSRKNVYITKKLIKFVIFTMYFSGGLIPTFLLIKNYLHLVDTYWALWLPGLISTYNMIIMRSGFAAIPDSMEESAKLDGANDFLILFRIMVPLAMPTIAVILLYYGVGHWNSWFNAMIYINTRTKIPLSLVLREILLSNSTETLTSSSSMSGDTMPIAETIKYATTIVATVPILIVYPFLQKYFVKGMMIGAVKG